MDYQPNVLLKLFSEAAQKAELSFEHSETGALADEINDYGSKSSVLLSRRFLYEAHRKIKSAADHELPVISFNPSYINRIAQYLDFRDFSQYQQKQKVKQTKEPANDEESKHGPTSIIGKNINKIEGDMHGDINNN